MQFSSIFRRAGRVALGAGFVLACCAAVWAQQTSFGINLSGGKEPVKIEADGMEMQDKEGIAIFTGNVSVAQGDRILRAGKMVVHYIKPKDNAVSGAVSGAASGAVSGPAQKNSGGLGSTGIGRMEASGKVYIKAGSQVATGDEGVFDGKSNVMTLTGSKVVLTDGENVATGCKLTAHMDTGKAFLESCSSSRKKGRVSIIMNRNEQN